MDAEFALRELCEVLRVTGWERARGELRAMQRGWLENAYIDRYERMVDLINDFISQIDDLLEN